MTLLVIAVTNGPAHVPIFPTRWLVAATIISSRGFGCVDLTGRGRALRPRAVRAVIATIPIMLTLLMVPARFFQGLSSLGTMRRHGLCLLRVEQKGASVPEVILGRFSGGAVALGAESIYFTDLQKKVQGGLGFSYDSFLNGLVADVLSTIFLLGLGTDGGPEAVAE